MENNFALWSKSFKKKKKKKKSQKQEIKVLCYKHRCVSRILHLLVRSAHQLASRTFPVVSLGAGTSFLPFIISRLDIVPILFNKAMNQLIDKKKTFSILFPCPIPLSLSISLSLLPFQVLW